MIAAFDIGTRNLSFAIIKPTDTSYEIIEWVNVDLVQKAQETANLVPKSNAGVCSCKTKTGKPCASKNVVSVSRIAVEKRLLGMSKGDLVTLAGGSQTQQKKDLMQDILSKVSDGDYCSRHFPSGLPFKFEDLKALVVSGDARNRKKITDILLTAAMVSVLDTYPVLLDVNTILIEIQMRKDMICIAAQIKGYLITRRLVDRNRPDFQIIDMPAIKKLCMYDGPAIVCKLKTIHTRNKYFGVAHAMYLLKDRPEYLSIINESKKKDDMCDTLLMCLYHLYVVTLKTREHIPFIDPARAGTKPRKHRSVFSKYNKKIRTTQ